MPKVGAHLEPPGCLLLVGVQDGPWMSDPTLPPHMESPSSGFWFPIPKWIADFCNSLTCTSAWTFLKYNQYSKSGLLVSSSSQVELVSICT